MDELFHISLAAIESIIGRPWPPKSGVPVSPFHPPSIQR